MNSTYLRAVDVEVGDLAELRKLLLHLRALDVLLHVLDVATGVAGLLLLLLLHCALATSLFGLAARIRIPLAQIPAF